MAIRSLKTGAMSRSALAGNPFILPGSFESLQSVTLTGSQTMIEFASIPTTYSHLQVRVSGRSTGAYTYSSCYLRYNNDSGNNYTYHSLFGDGSSAAAYGRGLAGDNIMVSQNITGATALSGNFGTVLVDIIDYSNTNKYKVTRSMGGYDNNGSGTPIGTICFNSSNWNSTSAITNIKLYTDGDFAAGTVASLYGIG